VRKYGTGLVSVGQLPLAAAMIVAATLVGRRLNRGTPVRTFFVFGVGFTVLGWVSLVVLQVGSPYLAFVPGLVLVGVGIGCFNTPSASLFVSEAPKESYGVVTSSRLMVGQFGYSLATALSSVIVNDFTEGGVVKKLIAAGVPRSYTGTAWTGVSDYIRLDTDLPATTAAQEALRDSGPSYVHAFIVAMLIFAVVTIVVGLGAAWLVRKLPGAKPNLKAAPGDPDGGATGEGTPSDTTSTDEPSSTAPPPLTTPAPTTEGSP
jgi:MFS family permease